MTDKKITVEFHCPTECVERVRWAMLKAAHESLMRWYDKTGYTTSKCMSCEHADEYSGDCITCSVIGNGMKSNFKEKTDE